MGDYVIMVNLYVYNKKISKDNIGVSFYIDMSEQGAESIDAVEKNIYKFQLASIKRGYLRTS